MHQSAHCSLSAGAYITNGHTNLHANVFQVPSLPASRRQAKVYYCAVSKNVRTTETWIDRTVSQKVG